MIVDTQQFFIDTLRLIPFENATILIQSPHEEVLSVLDKMEFKEEGSAFKSIQLNRRNREIFIFEIVYNGIEEYMQSLEIRIGNTKVFEGYDGMEYGMFSKDFILPEDFKEEYTQKDMCMVSKDW